MSVVWTRYGAPAYTALRAETAQAKAGNPLAPVTVLVPTHLSGVIARRTLARGLNDRNGIAALSVLTLDRLAERLATPMLVEQGRRPATDAVLAAAWRHVLADDAGIFAPVKDHPATVRALVAAHRELREVDETSLTAIETSSEPVAAEVARLHRRVVSKLAASWYDVADLRRTAVEALNDRPALAREIGTVVLFQPQELTLGASALLQALGAAGDVRVIAAITGDDRADAGVNQALNESSAAIPDAPTATRVLHASDADDEIRCVVRDVTKALKHTPAHRIAILYGSRQPYARLLADHLAAAKIPWNGTGVRPTIERTLARVLLDVLALPDVKWRRDAVLAVLSAAPVRDTDGQRVPASRWERISRIAGVVANGDWDTRLKAYAAQERTAADHEKASDTRREGLISRRERDAEAADALSRFVKGLQTRLEEGASLREWPALSLWARDIYRTLVGDLDGETWLPEDEARAAEKVTRTLTGLAGLGAVESTADLTTLRLTLELELADDLPRHGRFGDGILVSGLSGAVGLDADVVFVVGVAEDLVPGRIRPDALLPEQVRALTRGQLPPIRERMDRQRRHLLAALAAAPECVVSFPRGDLRKSSTRLPSRWLLPSLRALSGQPQADATHWQALPGLVSSRSFAASMAHTDHLASEQEWRVRAAAAEILTGDPTVTAAVTMLHARRGDALTRFDGDLSGQGVPDPAAGQAVSPTALEAWVRCPHGYFIERMLGVQPVESPEELVQITPLEIGNLIHAALDRFFAAQAEAGTVPGGAKTWTAGQRAELARIATEVGDELAARGATGHPLLWRQELTRILVDLDQLLDDDQALRASTGRQQVRSELAFGMHGADAVPIVLPDGRVVRFKGSADRVDRAGDAIVVVDYKTGSAKYFQGISEADPTLKGAKLQLPVYAYAARAALGTPDAEVSAEYWFLRKDAGTRKTLDLTPDVERGYREALAVIVDGIAAGLYPNRPPEQDGHGIGCDFCDPDGMGATEHRERWARKRTDPRLAAYLNLVEGGAAT